MRKKHRLSQSSTIKKIESPKRRKSKTNQTVPFDIFNTEFQNEVQKSSKYALKYVTPSNPKRRESYAFDFSNEIPKLNVDIPIVAQLNDDYESDSDSTSLTGDLESKDPDEIHQIFQSLIERYKNGVKQFHNYQRLKIQTKRQITILKDTVDELDKIQKKVDAEYERLELANVPIVSDDSL